MQFVLHTHSVRVCTRVHEQMRARVNDARISRRAHTYVYLHVRAYIASISHRAVVVVVKEHTRISGEASRRAFLEAVVVPTRTGNITR